MQKALQVALGIAILFLYVPPGASAPRQRVTPGKLGVTCPETLPNDDARRAAALDFVQRYGAIHPRSHMGERLAARARLLQQRGCRPETQNHDFPET